LADVELPVEITVPPPSTAKRTLVLFAGMATVPPKSRVPPLATLKARLLLSVIFPSCVPVPDAVP